MSRLIWTRQALADLRRLADFLATKDLPAARRATQRLLEGVTILERHPDIGKPNKDYGVQFREWSIRFGATGYVALYRHDGNEITLLRLRSFREAGFDERTSVAETEDDRA